MSKRRPDSADCKYAKVRTQGEKKSKPATLFGLRTKMDGRPRGSSRRQTLGPGEAGEDGDFVQLRIIREQRRISQESQQPSIARRPSYISEGEVEVEATQQTRAAPPRPTTAAREDAIRRLRDQMYTAATQGTNEEVLSIVNKIPREVLVQSAACHPDTEENILHFALSNGKNDLAKILVQQYGEPLILSYHTVKRSGIHGKNNALHIVTEKGDIEMAKYLLNKLNSKEKRFEIMKVETAVDIQGQRPRSFSCLHLAAYYGHSDLVRLYLDSGLDVNHLNGKKDTALLWAARWGKNDTVSLLLERGADPEVKNDKGSTAIYWAVRYGHAKTVSLLLQQGRANPNTTRKLGLVAPLVVACAYGDIEIVQVLLQHPDIEVNIRIRGGEMPIHHAAREGYLDVLDCLIKKGALFNEPDELGDSPLLLATQNGHVDLVDRLIEVGGNALHRNDEGNDTWYYAIESDGNELLQALLLALRGKEMKGRQPLCIAANNGRCDKIDFLLKMKQDPLKGDMDGNTFLHHAAMTDKHEVLEQFHSRIPIDTPNKRGNTPLHIASYRGFDNSISTLLACKAKADVKNDKSETCLHVSAYSKYISADTANKLVQYTIKTHAWESLNAKDIYGNNCLHIAGKFAKPEVMWEFRFVRFKDRDQDGNTPLHEAVRHDEPEALMMMLDIFESMKRDARINEQSYARSETVLHLAADQGLPTCVKRLIGLGGDIANKDVNGDTVLHRLVRNTVMDPKNINTHLEVFDTILNNVVKWWCIKKTIPYPEEDNSDAQLALRREATLYVINDIYNKEGLSVLAQSFKIGAPEILSRLLMMRDVTMFEYTDSGSYTFDISHVTPRTSDAIHGCCTSAKVAPLDQRERDVLEEAEVRLSGIEWLITQDVDKRAATILDLPPIKRVEQYYVSMVAWTFALLMIFHIVYMSLFTYIAVNLLDKLRTDESQINSSDPETLMLYIVVPLEPAIIIIYVFYTFIRYAITGDIGRRSKLSRRKGFAQIASVITAYLFIVVMIIFAVLVVVWIALFTERYHYQDYFLAAALCLGWMLTISFTRGIRLIHYFYRLLISMVVRDVVRFLIVYLFVLMAFGFAFHVLFQVSGEVIKVYNTPGDTLFLAFNMMIGMGELFDGTFETTYANDVGRSVTYIKIFYLLYMILGTIILLNLLIAMMNDSYTRILTAQQVTWRIESVTLGVEIENNFPMSKVFSNVRIAHGPLGPEMSAENNPINDRWHLSMGAEEFNQYSRQQDQLTSTTTDNLSRRIEEMELKAHAQEEKTTAKLNQITELLEQLNNKRGS